MLKISRIVLAFVVFVCLTAYFLDFTGVVPDGVRWLTKIQVIPALKGHGLPLLLAVIVLTLFMGRLYCSVLCPLGILQDFFAWFARLFQKKPKYQYHPAKRAIRWTLFGVTIIGSVVVGSVVLSLLDPYSIYGRIATNLFRPVYIWGNNLLAEWGTSHDIYTFYYVENFVQSVAALVISLAMLVLLGFLASRYGRLYCNTICPVGTFLGIFSRFSWLKIRFHANRCVGCGLCANVCKSSCIDSQTQTIDASRCVDCFNCLGVCRKNAIQLTIPCRGKPQESTSSTTITESLASDASTKVTKHVSTAANDQLGKDVPNENSTVHDAGTSRRELLSLVAVTLGSAAVPTAMGAATGTVLSLASREASGAAIPEASASKGLALVYTGTHPYTRENPISPPGVIATRRLVHHCTACHLCVSRCPSHILRPALLEYGLAGFLQPTMDFNHGFCNYDCTDCGDVCPNHAIRSLSVEEKHRTQVGQVVFIPENCVVTVDGTNCGACAEHCPTQAVRMVPYHDHLTIPEVDVELCVGCGACEFICPTRPYRAIHIEGNPKHLEAKLIVQEKEPEVKVDDFGF